MECVTYFFRLSFLKFKTLILRHRSYTHIQSDGSWIKKIKKHLYNTSIEIYLSFWKLTALPSCYIRFTRHMARNSTFKFLVQKKKDKVPSVLMMCGCIRLDWNIPIQSKHSQTWICSKILWISRTLFWPVNI